MNKILAVDLKKSKYKITPYSGLMLTYGSMLGLGLDKAIERELPGPGSNRGFSPSEYAVALMLMQHSGGRELEDMQKLRVDQAMTDILKERHAGGKKVIPGSDATGNWLRRMGGQKMANGRAAGLGLLGLGRVQRWFCNRILAEMGVTEVTLDADATIITADKEEAAWTYKKVKGFQPMLGLLPKPILM